MIDEESQEWVGWFWVGKASDGALGSAWLFDIEIIPAHRGLGHGHTILKMTETAASEMGFSHLGLHVFAHNHIARALYEGAGFELTDLCYQKPL
ncbi:MAG: GNAT family N-acetyltransferase [Candidatus Synoicihabitans palmerolidicus]|nr:GNAT family N-acetyltransferase [Candidatus Synoicihabitans palmerolidicus]